jgi:uncharacterized membrane protein required for colicin V production
MASVIDGGVVLTILILTFLISFEGAWGAVIMFFNLVFAALVSLGYFEPVSALIAENSPAEQITPFADLFAIGGLFAITLTVLRLTTDYLSQSIPKIPDTLEKIGCYAFSLAAALVLTGMILIIFHASPTQKRLFGVMDYTHAPPFQMGLAENLVMMVGNLSQGSLASYPDGNTPKAYPNFQVWFKERREKRPYGSASATE